MSEAERPDPPDATDPPAPELAPVAPIEGAPAPDAPKADPSKLDAPPNEPPKPDGAKAAPKKKKRKWLRRLLIAFAMFPVFLLGLWIAIHKIEWLGPWLANAGRSIFGNEFIAKLEDFTEGVQDKYNIATRSDEKPKAAWVIPPKKDPPVDSNGVSKSKYPVFTVKDVGPMLQSFSAPGDGQWVPMEDEHAPDEPAPMMKTLLHPDAKRAWAQVAVVAADLRQIELHSVAGTVEPATTLADARAHKRTGFIPEVDLPTALAAFNGGFMTTHGHYGMKAEGVVWVEPHAKACTIAMYPNDLLKIRSWEELESTESDMLWFRQTPMCMVENGTLHPALGLEENTYWGSTLDKDTIIRRSAMGISEDGNTLFIGIGEATSAAAIAKAMQFAGSFHVAQLDVNWSYPKFVAIQPKSAGSSEVKLEPLVDTFKFQPDDYVKRPEVRDFFYITRLPQPKPSDPAKAN